MKKRISRSNVYALLMAALMLSGVFSAAPMTVRATGESIVITQQSSQSTTPGGTVNFEAKGYGQSGAEDSSVTNLITWNVSGGNSVNTQIGNVVTNANGSTATLTIGADETAATVTVTAAAPTLSVSAVAYVTVTQPSGGGNPSGNQGGNQGGNPTGNPGGNPQEQEDKKEDNDDSEVPVLPIEEEMPPENTDITKEIAPGVSVTYGTNTVSVDIDETAAASIKLAGWQSKYNENLAESIIKGYDSTYATALTYTTMYNYEGSISDGFVTYYKEATEQIDAYKQQLKLGRPIDEAINYAYLVSGGISPTLARQLAEALSKLNNSGSDNSGTASKGYDRDVDDRKGIAGPRNGEDIHTRVTGYEMETAGVTPEKVLSNYAPLRNDGTSTPEEVATWMEAFLNCNGGILEYLLDTANGGSRDDNTDESGMLSRMNDLTGKESQKTAAADDNEYTSKEKQELMKEVEEEAKKTTFNEMKLLEGNFKGKGMQIDTDSNSISVKATEKVNDADASEQTIPVETLAGIMKDFITGDEMNAENVLLVREWFLRATNPGDGSEDTDGLLEEMADLLYQTANELKQAEAVEVGSTNHITPDMRLNMYNSLSNSFNDVDWVPRKAELSKSEVKINIGINPLVNKNTDYVISIDDNPNATATFSYTIADSYGGLLVNENVVNRQSGVQLQKGSLVLSFLQNGEETAAFDPFAPVTIFIPYDVKKAAPETAVLYDKNTGKTIAHSFFEDGYVIASVAGAGHYDVKTVPQAGKTGADAFAASHGLLGADGKDYNAGKAITRAEFIMALGELSGADMSVYTQSSFKDVSKKNPAMPYIEWAVQNGIAQGTDTQRFNPGGFITREQIAVLLLNYAKATNRTMPVIYEDNIYTDDAKINGWAAYAVMRAQWAGVMDAKTRNAFVPQGSVTHTEAGEMLYRFARAVVLNG